MEQAQAVVKAKKKATKINRMVMHGFKSFAKHTEIPFTDGFNCVLGPNGAGKCVTKETIVSLSDGSQVSIGNLVDGKIKKNPVARTKDGYIAGGDGTRVLCLDTKSLKIQSKPVKAFVKRSSPKKLVKIRTRTGKQLMATTYHPLFILKNNRITSVNADQLHVGTRIALPRKINFSPRDCNFFKLLDYIKVSDNIFIPYQPKVSEILRKLKVGTWKQTARKIGIPSSAIKGILDKQSTNFSYAVKIFRHANFSDQMISQLITNIKGKTSSKTYPMIWKNSDEFSRLLGYLLAEGRLTKNSQLWFTNSTPEIVEDYTNLVKSLFQCHVTINEYKPNCYDVLAYPQPWITLLSYFGLSPKGTAHKSISELYVTSASKTHAAHLLDGLYSGDGYIGDHSIEITSKSKLLAQVVETLLLRLGIVSSSKYQVKVATNSGYSGVYKTIVIQGQEHISQFVNHVALTHPKKQRKILSLLGKKSNTNVDLLEVNQLIKEVARDEKINIKRTKEKFPRLDAYCYNQCTPSRNGVNLLVTKLFKQTKSSSFQQLKVLANSDIFWDEIVSLETIPSKEPWVYDLCVDDHHNFVANSMFIHNSNVLDALCFVLGKSSSKSLRAESSGNLVYNGGKTKQAAKQGEVSIYFDNKDNMFPMDTEEIKLSRIVKQTGQSKYKINDETKTRREVVELLNVAKIDPDGYNIILQGDIVRLVEMPPVERRLLVEDIAGISLYEEKKQKAIKELEKVEQHLNDTEIILKERESYLKELKKDRDQALKYKEMNDKVKQNRASYLHIQINNKKKEKEHLEKKETTNNQELTKITETIEKLHADQKEKEGKLADITKEIEEKGEVQQVALNKEVEALKIEITKSQSRQEQLKSEQGKIEQRRRDLKHNLDDISQRMESQQKEKNELSGQLKNKKNELEEISHKVRQFKSKHNLDDIGNIEKKVDDIDKETEDIQKQVHILREKQHDFIRQKDKVSHELALIHDRMQKIKDVEKEHRQQLEHIAKKRAEFKKSTLELNKRLDQDSTISAKLNQARSQLQTTSEELSALRAKNISIQETTRADVAIKKILERKKPGIYGTVADLGNVSSKHALALEIAAGHHLRSIVVDSEKIAAECITFLKKNRFGTATFLPLNKIQPRVRKKELEVHTKKKGCSGFAIDLVEFDPKFKNIFSYVFENTLVVDTIDVAVHLGVGKAKIVTLDGDLADKSGAMHGGFRQRKRQALGFKEKEVTQQIDAKNQKVEELKQAIDIYEKDRIENEETISTLRQHKATLEGEIIKEEKSLHVDDKDLDASFSKEKELQEQEQSLDKSVNDIITKISGYNTELAKHKIERQKLRATITSLNNPRLVAELNAFEQKKHELNDEIIRIQTQLQHSEKLIQTISTPEQEKTQQLLKSLDKEETDFKTELHDLTHSLKEMKKNLSEKEKQASEFYAKFKGLFAQSNKIKDEVSKIIVSIEKKKDEATQIEIKVNTFSLKKAEFSAALTALEEEFAQYEGIELDVTKSEEELKKEIAKFERMKENIGSVNMRALDIYDEVEKQYNELQEKKDNLGKEREDVLNLMNEIEGKKKELFMETFDAVNNNFKKFFAKITTKGAEANLVIEDPENPFEAGVRINVKIGGSKFLDIRSLSGGEKTMTAIAFIFAIQEHDPATFYILDEVDAALDKHNSERLASMVKEYSAKAQYVIISHNDYIISSADNLYGVSMNEHGVSQVVSLRV